MKTPTIVTTSDNVKKHTADPANMFGNKPGVKTKKSTPKANGALFGGKGNFGSDVIFWGVHREDMDKDID